MTGWGLASLLMGWIGCARLLKRTIEPSPEALSAFGAIPFSAPWRRPALRVSARVRRPMLLGTFRPTIVIPPDLDEPDQADGLRLSLLHELAHAERLDPQFGFVSAVAGALWFYVPPAWWVRGQMRLDQEFLADCRAARRFGPGASYASSLVGLAAGGPGEGDGPGVVKIPGAATVSPLFLRVLMLVRCPFPVELDPPRSWRWSCAIALALTTVAASGLTLSGRVVAWPPLPMVCHPRGPDHGVIEINRLAIDARLPGADGRVSPYTLLVALPARFELVVDIWADPSDLPSMAIAGRRLGPPRSRPGDPPLVEGFHKVRLVRDDRGLSVWVSGRPVPPQPGDAPPSAMLSLQPVPGLTGRYRNLVLTW